jgi:hypothetical protein
VLTIASEANEICEKDSKKTMMPEHIVAALKVRTRTHLDSPSSRHPVTSALTYAWFIWQALGFEDFVGEVEDVLGEHKELAKVGSPLDATCAVAKAPELSHSTASPGADRTLVIHCLSLQGEKQKKARKQLGNGMSEAELLAAQEELFAASRARFDAGAAAPDAVKEE